MPNDKQKFLFELAGPHARARYILEHADLGDEANEDIAWIVKHGDDDYRIGLNENIFVILDGRCEKSHHGLHEVEMNTRRLVFPPNTMPCQLCGETIQFDWNKSWRYPSNF